MYELQKVINGISLYLDNEIISKITGWQKWVIGAGSGMYLSNATNVFNNIKNNPVIKSMNIINEDNQINIDEIYKHLHKESEKGPITFDVPMLGALTLNSTDVDKLYNYIRG